MPGFFDVEERLRELSAKGDDLERVKRLWIFEIFRPALQAAVSRADRSKGGTSSLRGDGHLLPACAPTTQIKYIVRYFRGPLICRSSPSVQYLAQAACAVPVPLTTAPAEARSR